MQYGTVRVMETKTNFQSNRERMDYIKQNYPEAYAILKEQHLLICLYPDYLVEVQTKTVNKVLANFFERPLLTTLELVPEL